VDAGDWNFSGDAAIGEEILRQYMSMEAIGRKLAHSLSCLLNLFFLQ